jgi:Fe-S-cluster containining protein
MSAGKINLSAFKKRAIAKKKVLIPFIKNIHRRKIPHLKKQIAEVDQEVWKEVDCISCANCCKTMTPTFTAADVKRIAGHLKITVPEFKDKYLVKDDEGAYINKKMPCQFLGKDNLCTIYDVRPVDCRSFPHTRHTRWLDQRDVFAVNMMYCPATLKMIEKMYERVVENKH